MNMCNQPESDVNSMETPEILEGYNFAYLDDQTKRMIRRAILKAVAIPGYQVPFGSREMPLPFGWGTGGIQVTASIIGKDDILKVIDQGADDTTNAVNIRSFFENPLSADQILVYQVPIPEPLRWIEQRESETRKMHALAEYGVMHVGLYENIAHFGRVTTSYDYPVQVNDRYIMSPSPIPKFDNPKMDKMPALQLFGAGREKRIYAVPPFTKVKSLDFEDHPFAIESWSESCALCGSSNSFLDEVIIDDEGSRMFVCSDSDFCKEEIEKVKDKLLTSSGEIL